MTLTSSWGLHAGGKDTLMGSHTYLTIARAIKHDGKKQKYNIA
jgi:hypothetical protein